MHIFSPILHALYAEWKNNVERSQFLSISPPAIPVDY